MQTLDHSGPRSYLEKLFLSQTLHYWGLMKKHANFGPQLPRSHLEFVFLRRYTFGANWRKMQTLDHSGPRSHIEFVFLRRYTFGANWRNMQTLDHSGPRRYFEKLFLSQTLQYWGQMKKHANFGPQGAYKPSWICFSQTLHYWGQLKKHANFGPQWAQKVFWFFFSDATLLGPNEETCKLWTTVSLKAILKNSSFLRRFTIGAK